MLKSNAKRAAVLASGIIVKLKVGTLLDAATTYAHFLNGQGAGSGWDVNETVVAAGLIASTAPVVFDVGANNGQWSRELAKRLGGDAQFHLFECAPICFDRLRQNMAWIPNSRHVRAAVSDKAGTATLHYPTSTRVGGGLGSLHARRDVSVPQVKYDEIDTATIRLDDYTDEQGIDCIDLLKMDIEGHEVFAMRGATRLFEARRVRALMFEFGSANVNSRTFFRDFWDMLTEYGFSISRLLPGGWLQPVVEYSETLEYFRGATNYGAILQRDLRRS